MHRHWREFGPPVHMAVAAYLGLTKPAARTVDGADLADFLSTLGPRA